MIKTRTKISITICVVAIIALLIINPSRYIQSAYNGFILFATAVLPALFPFFFFSKILTAIGTANTLSCFMRSPIKLIYNTPPSSGYILVMSLISGYPIGASLTAIYYEQGYITSHDARTITAFCSTSGSLFIVGTVATQMFHNKSYGYILLLAHYCGAFINGLLYRRRITKTVRENYKDSLACKASFGECVKSFVPPVNNDVNDNVISTAISNSVTSILVVGGYIAIFSIIIDVCADLKIIDVFVNFFMLFRIPDDVAQSLITGMIEITRGCLHASTLEYSPLLVLPLTCAIISFGGVAVGMQSITFLSRCGVSSGQYFLRKLTQAIISAGICFLICLAIF